MHRQPAEVHEQVELRTTPKRPRGHGCNPPTYTVLLQQLASHGFVVVALGTPLPQITDKRPLGGQSGFYGLSS
ncbi:MAG TPA: hypothetical protein VIV60_03440 [Polyangiaceae bacterium]